MKSDHIRTPNRFRPVLPSSRLNKNLGKVRSVTWINEGMNTNNWEIINIPDTNDITAINLRGDHGKIAIFNVYNACDNNKVQVSLQRYLEEHREDFYGEGDKHAIWCGDFNRHHPLWDCVEDTDLFQGQNRERADKFIQILADFDMMMALPRDIPTIQTHRSKRFTRPDNVFMTEQLLEKIIICDVDAFWRPPCTDHFPITTIINIEAAKTSLTPSLNFKMTNWKQFRTEVENRLPELKEPGPFDTTDELDTQINCLTRILQESMTLTTPRLKPCPHMKRWWNGELERIKKDLNKLNRRAHRQKFPSHHPSYKEYSNLRSNYAEAILEAKKKHWEDFLEEATDREMWTANRYLKEPIGDGGKPRIPTLVTKDANDAKHRHVTNVEKATALSNNFFPKSPSISTVPANHDYPAPLERPNPVNETQVLSVIKDLSPHKAPGPDGIPNIVLQESASLIAPYLASIFEASLKNGHQHPEWKSFTTAVIRKPGKPSYEAPKAYRPIALLNTMSKVLTAVITEEVSCLLENNQLLPTKHFGGRPCRNTTDAVHYLVNKIKEAWRQDSVVSVLYLDVEGAFPNAVTDRLIHNMRKRRIPTLYVNYVKSLLSDRKTQLRFDDYLSDPIPINNGIGQGDPLSMLLYLIYNADMLQIPEGKEEDALGYVDDICFIAIGKDFQSTTLTLQNMMNRPNGGFDWSRTHNSKFALDKLAVTHFSRRGEEEDENGTRGKKLNRPALILGGKEVEKVEVYKYLGVHIDSGLKWKVQEEKAVARATKWVLQFKRLAKPAKGISQSLMRRLYLGVAIPKMTYALDIWYDPPFLKPGAKKRSGSVRALKQLQKIQRIAALAITGGLHTTPNDLLDAHAGLTPLQLTLDKICHRNVTRICSLPNLNPLTSIAINDTMRTGKRHLTNLQILLQRYELDPRKIETIRPPVFTSADPLPITTEITETREESIAKEQEDVNRFRAYSDGSGQNGKIGAAAVLVDVEGTLPTKTLHYHLGTSKEHTTYEAEAVGALLAMRLITNLVKQAEESGEANPAISHYVDNQSVIKALHSRKCKPGQYLIDSYRRRVREVCKPGRAKVSTRWISAHSGVELNELVDKAAKEAAAGRSSDRQELPPIISKGMKSSISAIKQAKNADIKEQWHSDWEKSPRYERMKSVDPDHPYKKFRDRRE